jgi:pimeloyl-ACP methyl ester carboxylesterase
MKADIAKPAPVSLRKRGFFRWMRYLLTGLVGLLIALVFAGAIYEGIESRRDRRQYLSAVRAEAAAQRENSAQVRALASLGNLPPVVLSHDPDKVRFPVNLSEPVNREWGKMQEELAQLSSNGSHLVVKGSGHDIQIDKPEAVVDAIREVVGQAKGAGYSSSER